MYVPQRRAVKCTPNNYLCSLIYSVSIPNNVGGINQYLSIQRVSSPIAIK